MSKLVRPVPIIIQLVLTRVLSYVKISWSVARSFARDWSKVRPGRPSWLKNLSERT